MEGSSHKEKKMAQKKAAFKKTLDTCPQKRFGQHFLVDHTIISKIIDSTGIKKNDLVLEIGPGMGALTIPLARLAGHVIAIEKDYNLASLLKDQLELQKITNVTIINHDILSWNFADIRQFNASEILVVGNLPYNISKPILEKLIANRAIITRAVLMFQLEVARRIAAQPGGKIYGSMTLLIKYHARATKLFTVKKGAFWPVPKVDSMVIDLDFKRPYYKQIEREDIFRKIVKMAFTYRRKTLFNSIKGLIPDWEKENFLEVFDECGISPQQRAETLDMDDYLCLALSDMGKALAKKD